MNTSFYSAVKGTNGPIINDSGGVSKIELKQMLCVSPIRKTEEEETPVISI